MQYAAYKRAQAYLEALPQQVFAPRHQQPLLSLTRTRKLLAAVGHPERRFRSIHITGTSGKGTVSTMVYEILRAAGRRVGLFTSPHVTTTLERIALNGRLTSVADFLWAYQQLRPYVDQCLGQEREYVPSHFEVLFAMALLIFQRRRVRWAVLEVGCGGEFDPTNVIPAPAIAAITNIGLDHQHLLGRTKVQIAKTKAGIFKRGSIGFSTETDVRIQRVLSQQARSERMPLTFVPATGMTHAAKNALLARVIGQYLRLPPRTITRGLQRTQLPARIEHIAPHVILDGSHNADKLSALVQTLRMLDYQRVHVIFGIGMRKDTRRCLRPLLPIASRWTLTQASVRYPAPMAPQRIVRILQDIQPESRAAIKSHAEAALAHALRTRRAGELILVTGSFYLAGQLRTRWVPERYILTHRTVFR